MSLAGAGSTALGAVGAAGCGATGGSVKVRGAAVVVVVGGAVVVVVGAAVVVVGAAVVGGGVDNAINRWVVYNRLPSQTTPTPMCVNDGSTMFA